MDDELTTTSDLFGDNREERMSRSGSVCCLSKRTISVALECILSCVSFTSLIYIILLVYCLALSVELDLVFVIIGYISILSLITTPLGIFGSNKGSYCALFFFIIFASYHLYGLVMYFWFNLKAPLFTETGSGSSSNGGNLKLRGYEYLHYVTSGSYTLLVATSILLASCNIVSLAEQIEPARVIVVDNGPE